MNGLMSETTFRPMDEAALPSRFEPLKSRKVGRGAVGVLIPPLEYHDFGNAGDVEARTVHVYGGDLRKAHAFLPDESGRYHVKTVELHYDA